MERKAIFFVLVLIDEASLFGYGNVLDMKLLYDSANVHDNLDETLRKWLKGNCGKPFQANQPSFRSIRSIGGEKVTNGEYPWVAAIETDGAFCSGALISPRHVLTAGHCVTSDFDERICMLKEILKEEAKEWSKCVPLSTNEIKVYIGAYHNRPYDSERYGYSMPIVVNLTIHPKCDQCTFDHDLALIQVSPNVFRHGPPICMPLEDETVPDNVTFAGYGLNPKHPEDQPLEAVNLTVDWNSTNEFPQSELIVTRSPDKAICSGDSGGPLFKWNGTRHILLGIASSGYGCQEGVGDKAGMSFFENVSIHLEWVCQNSGVCSI